MISLLLSVGLSTASAHLDDPEDPAPPLVHELAPLEAPSPKGYPQLRIHRPPRAMSAGAVIQDWPTFLGPERNGQSTEVPLLDRWSAEGPTLIWEMERGAGFASPVIQGARLVYTHRIGENTVVDCLEAETGKRYWRYETPCTYEGDEYIDNDGPLATPVIADERVYVHSVDGSLLCLDLATGRLVFERQLTEEFGVAEQFFGVVSSPVVFGDLLIQNVGGAPPAGPSVAAFDLRSGRLRWRAGERWGPSCASPVIATPFGKNAKVFVVTGGKTRPATGGLMVMDALTGELDFEYPFRSRTYLSVTGATPLIANGTVLLSSSYGVGSTCLKLAPGGGFEERWNNRHIGLQFSTPVFVDGAYYAIDGVSERHGSLVCIDPANGEELSRTGLDWEYVVTENGEEKHLNGSVGEGSLLVADGRLYCLGDGGDLLAIEATPAGAKVLAHSSLFRANQSWTPLVLSRGLLYVCQNSRARFGDSPPRLLCYDLRGE